MVYEDLVSVQCQHCRFLPRTVFKYQAEEMSFLTLFLVSCAGLHMGKLNF